MAERIFLTEQQAIDLLPEGEQIHTHYNIGTILVGADWDRQDVLDKIHMCECREVTGPNARALSHGLCLYHKDTKWHSDILFVETNMELLERLYPEEEEDKE